MFGKVKTCVLNMPMNEGQGHPHDSSGYGNNGTNNGADWVSGDYGWALDFNGSSDYVNCGSASSLSPTTDITLSTWVKYGADPTTFNGMIIDSDAYSLYSRSTSSEIQFLIGSTIANLPFTQIDDTKWFNVVGTYDSSNLRVYYNGILKDTEPRTVAIPSAGSAFIGDRNTTGLQFNGLINDVRIYNRVLPVTELLANFNATKARYGL